MIAGLIRDFTPSLLHATIGRSGSSARRTSLGDFNSVRRRLPEGIVLVCWENFGTSASWASLHFDAAKISCHAEPTFLVQASCLSTFFFWSFRGLKPGPASSLPPGPACAVWP